MDLFSFRYFLQLSSSTLLKGGLDFWKKGSSHGCCARVSSAWWLFPGTNGLEQMVGLWRLTVDCSLSPLFLLPQNNISLLVVCLLFVVFYSSSIGPSCGSVFWIVWCISAVIRFIPSTLCFCVGRRKGSTILMKLGRAPSWGWLLLWERVGRARWFDSLLLTGMWCPSAFVRWFFLCTLNALAELCEVRDYPCISSSVLIICA